jgi:hypothetical protein
VFGAFLSACSLGADTSGPISTRAHIWDTSSGFSLTREYITGDISKIELLNKRKNFLGVKTVCVLLGEDSAKANDELPTPVDSLTNYLVNSYKGLFKFSLSCYHSSGRLSSSQLIQLKTAFHQFNLGSSLLVNLEKPT